MDIEAFGTIYVKYDLINSRFNRWIYIYPFCELSIEISFLNSSRPSLIIFIALILGILGIDSGFKAIYLNKLKLYCGCIGGYAKNPLGIFSLIENLFMASMSLLIIIRMQFYKFSIIVFTY